MSQRRNQHRIEIVVFDKEDKEIRHHTSDLKGQGTKNWIFDLIYWASKNGYCVEFTMASEGNNESRGLSADS